VFGEVQNDADQQVVNAIRTGAVDALLESQQQHVDTWRKAMG
jgi:hypothetical protein